MSTEYRTLVTDIHRTYRKKLEPIPTGEVPITRVLDGIEAVLFDIYGTLLVSGSGDVGTASLSSRTILFREAIANGGAGPIEPPAGARAESSFYSAIRESHALSKSRGIDYPEVDIISIWNTVLGELEADGAIAADITHELCAKVATAYEVLVNPVVTMPGASRAIEKCTARGLRLGLVSNAQFFTPHLLAFELGKPLVVLGFDPTLIAFSYLLGQAKPSPAIFGPVLNQLEETYGIPPSSTLYVGNDMLNDVYTASKAGCRTCLFAGDSRSLRLRRDDKRCADLEQDTSITELGQLDMILGSIC